MHYRFTNKTMFKTDCIRPITKRYDNIPYKASITWKNQITTNVSVHEKNRTTKTLETSKIK